MQSLKEFRHNFTEEALIAGTNIIVESQDRDIIITIPTYKESLSHYDFNTFVAILNAKYDYFAKFKDEMNFKFVDRKSLLRGLILWSYFKQIVQNYLKKYIKDIEFEEIKATIKGVKITAEEYELIADILLVGLAIQSYDFEKEQSDQKEKEDEVEKQPKSEKIRQLLNKEKEVQNKLKAAKKKKAKNSGTKVTMERYIMATIYQFGISRTELFNSNPYTVFWYFKYVDILDIHQVNQIAAGNGLLSDKRGKSKYTGLLHY